MNGPWHCRRCEVQWNAPDRRPCFNCGLPAARGMHVNRSGKAQPVTSSMTWRRDDGVIA